MPMANPFSVESSPSKMHKDHAKEDMLQGVSHGTKFQHLILLKKCKHSPHKILFHSKWIDKLFKTTGNWEVE